MGLGPFNWNDDRWTDICPPDSHLLGASLVGVWTPGGCYNGGLRIGIDITNASKLVKSYIYKACEHARKEYLAVGLKLFYIIKEGNPGPCEILKNFVVFPVGDKALANNMSPKGGCTQIRGSFATRATPQEWQQFARIEMHETGHGLGLSHTTDEMSLMYTRLPNTSVLPTWKGDSSRAALVKIINSINKKV